MKLMLQICLVCSVCWLGDGISLLLPFPFPGSVIAMILLFFLLATILKPEMIRTKTDFLLQNMAFFFIPVGVDILGQASLLLHNWFPILAICLITTLLTFTATAFSVKGAVWLQNRISASRRISSKEDS